MLDARDIAWMQEALAEASAAVEQPITYRRYSHTDPGDPALGIPPQDVYVDESATAAVRELTLQEVQVSAGAYQVGDTEFVVRRAAADARDRILYDGAEWVPVELRRMYLGTTLGFKIVARRRS